MTMKEIKQALFFSTISDNYSSKHEIMLELYKRCQQYAKLTHDMFKMMEHGDYSNGNVHNGIDEGNVMASGMIDQFNKEREKLEQ